MDRYHFILLVAVLALGLLVYVQSVVVRNSLFERRALRLSLADRDHAIKRLEEIRGRIYPSRLVGGDRVSP